jgi:acyl-CoA-dependent ceramide synthase
MHQILILNAEARRKDHAQMMAHHIITVILMVTSYFTNFTRVGCVIMVLMDWCDIFLPVRPNPSWYSGRDLYAEHLDSSWRK